MVGRVRVGGAAAAIAGVVVALDVRKGLAERLGDAAPPIPSARCRAAASAPQISPEPILMVRARIVVLKKKDITPWISVRTRIGAEVVAMSAVCEAQPMTKE